MQIEVSFDGGWQKRGTGWNYDSNTGTIDIGVWWISNIVNSFMVPDTELPRYKYIGVSG